MDLVEQIPRTTIRCVLVHDHILLRQGLRRLLEDEPDIDVVSEANNAAECLRRVSEFRPDVVVADAETFGLSVADAELRVARESFETKIVLLSMQEEPSPKVAGWQSVAAGCAVRQTSAEELVEMVRVTCRHQSAFPEASLGCKLPFSGVVEDLLTGREREVMKLLAEGKTVRTAAALLGLSSKTVDSHKFNLMRKLRIHNKAQLVMWAIQKRVVKIPVNF